MARNEPSRSPSSFVLALAVFWPFFSLLSSDQAKPQRPLDPHSSDGSQEHRPGPAGRRHRPSRAPVCGLELGTARTDLLIASSQQLGPNVAEGELVFGVARIVSLQHAGARSPPPQCCRRERGTGHLSGTAGADLAENPPRSSRRSTTPSFTSPT